MGDLSVSVDRSCVEDTLTEHFENVRRYEYSSDGSNEYPSGTRVDQFYYGDLGYTGDLRIQIGDVRGKSRVTHDFTSIGSKIPQEAFPPAVQQMQRANGMLLLKCGLDMRPYQMKAIGQEVEAIK
ncbi:MAG: hypothetical protein HKO13_05660 [Sphingomonas sp.]|nr:hypothetical protein [Sphingomonas sp.]